MASETVRSSTRSTEYKGVSKQVKITMAAKVIFSAYRRDDFADPDNFVLQLGVLLEQYDIPVIEYISSPVTGVQRKYDYPPNIKQIGDACETEAARRLAIAKAAHQPRIQFNRDYVPLPNFPGCRANVLVLYDAPQYATVKAWAESGEADSRDWIAEPRGIKIALTKYEALCAGQLNTGGRMRHATLTDAELRAMYGKRENAESESGL